MAVTAIEWTGSPLTRALVLDRAVRLEDDVTLEAGTYPVGYVLPGFTFNGWKGCEKVSPACEHCYAESWAKRCGYTPDGKHHLTIWGPAATTPRERTAAEYWRRPLRWNRIAEELGVRFKVFAFSLADVVEIPAAEHFLSLEPLLGPIDLARVVGQWETNIGDWGRRLWDCPDCCGSGYFQVDPYTVACPRCALSPQAQKGTGVGVSWAILGGGSGGGRRTMDLSAVDSIAKRCVAAHVPVFVKQDSGQHPGTRGRLPDDLWALKQWPQSGAV